jgi:hypothetical protein
MKALSLLVTALFLAASPVAFAQNEDNNSGGTGNDAGQDAGQEKDPSTVSNQEDQGPNCPEVGPNQNFDAFPIACRNRIDAWVNEQTGAPVTFEGDVAVGTVLPESVEIIEVPAYRGYGYAMLNDKRVLVDRDTRTVVRVF